MSYCEIKIISRFRNIMMKIFSRLIPKLLTYVLDKHFNIELSIKSVSLFDFSIRNICLKYADLELVSLFKLLVKKK